MKILILEDEPLVAKDLVKLLKTLEPEAEVLEILQSVEAAIKWFAKNEVPSLILSDIQLSDGTSFEVFQQVKTDTPIIFTTAFDEYAIRAFKLNSVDYLLKPIDVKELKSAILKYKNLQQSSTGFDQIQNFLQSLSSKQQKYKERFLVVVKNALAAIPARDISYFHKEELIFLYTKDNQRYLTEYKTLEELEHFLNPDEFYRVNRQYIVHVDSVWKIKTTLKGINVILKTQGNPEIEISREKATAFKKWVDR
jgi:two-component system, LytTR family, response regulator